MKTNLRVLGLLILFACQAAVCTAAMVEDPNSKSYAPYPQPDRGYVTDIANLLTGEQEEQLESWLYTTEKEKGFEMAVVTINSIRDYPGTANGSIESFATGLFNAYGIGNMPENNGVLLLVAVRDREARIELGASYRRRRDAGAEKIMQSVIIPRFKEGRYGAGIINGTRSLLWKFGRTLILPDWVKPALGGLFILAIPITISLFRNGKRGWGWVCVGFIIVLLLLLFVFIKTMLEFLLIRPRPGRWHGGFGRGFSGFGGATGRW